VYEPNIGYAGVAGCDYRNACSVTIYLIVLLFWAVPVSLIASLTSLDSLEEHWQWVSDLRDYPSLYNFVQTYLPTLSLTLFMAILPAFLKYMATAEGLKTKSAVDATLMQRYFAFLLLNILLVASLSGGIFAVAYDISTDLHSLPELLAKSLPNMYLFFVSYIMLQAMTFLPLDLLEYTNISYRWCSKVVGADRQSEYEAARHYAYSGAARLARHLLVFAISLVYSSFTPLMLPFSLLYFSLALLFERQQGYYVHVRPYESGGEMWMTITHCVLAGLGIYILAIMGMILLLEGNMQAFLLTPLIFVVVFVAYKMRMKYFALSQYLVLQKPDHSAYGHHLRGCCCCRPKEKSEADATASLKTEQTDPLVVSATLESEEVAFDIFASEFGGVAVVDNIDRVAAKNV